ncbi:MAG: helix-turn-helix transcriptional regulator [Phycisphaerae bacterium]|nr:helix-turn-helix transcriptional regulator [Phycisphaerae bacterium]
MTSPSPSSEAAVLRLLGERLSQYRLRRNLSQEALAQEAGVSERTLVRLEQGESTQLANLARVLRALGLLASLGDLVPPVPPSPLEQLRTQSKVRRRAARRVKRAKSDGPAEGGSPPWTWGDERGASGESSQPSNGSDA